MDLNPKNGRSKEEVRILKRKATAKPKKAVGSNKPNCPSFPIVGVGASAGGLEAFSQLLRELPSNTGMAYVFIQHLDPSQSSFLSKILGTKTSMPVQEITDGMEVLPNHVFVIPSKFDLDIVSDILHLIPRDKSSSSYHKPINTFFESLAKNCEKRALGVVLSGTATDGTEGLEAIKAEGGFTFVQSPSSAEFPGMPESAVAARVVDFSLPIPSLVKELIRIGSHPYYTRHDISERLNKSDNSEFENILDFLKSKLGVDFHEYKEATTKRRLARRLAFLHLDSLSEYLAFLHSHEEEARALYEDVLIHVTCCFRAIPNFGILK